MVVVTDVVVTVFEVGVVVAVDSHDRIHARHFPFVRSIE